MGSPGNNPVKALLLSLLLASGLSACRQDPEPTLLSGALEWDRVELLANESESIVRIEVVEGQQVAKNQVLLVLDTRLAQARLDGAVATREQSRARLDEVLRGPSKEQIAEARAVLKSSEARLLEARLEVQRQTDLVARDLGEEATLDRVISIRDSNQAQRESALQSLKAATEGSTDELIRQARFGLKAAEAQVAVQQRLLQRLQVLAPVAGIVDSLPLKTGAQPRSGQVVVVLLTGRPYARVDLPEPLRTRVSVGDRFAVRIDGLAGQQQARVRYLSRAAAFTPCFSVVQDEHSQLTFEMELEFDDPDIHALAAGIPLQVLLPESAL